MKNRIVSFFRSNSATIGVLVIVLAFMSILYLQSLAMSQLQAEVATQKQLISQVKGVTDQIKGVTDQLNANSADRTAQLQNLNRHMDCIVTFFTQPDRTQKAIANINTCTVTANKVSAPASSAAPAPRTTPAASPVPTSWPRSRPIPPTNPRPTPRVSITDRSIFQPVLDFFKSLGVQ